MDTRHYQTLYKTEKFHWWYKVRRKITHNLIDTYVDKTKSLKILDVGCGTGELLVELSSLGESFGIDNSPEAVKFSKEKGLKNILISEGTEIPFSDNYFDVVLCLDVLEHIQDDQKTIQEIFRVAKTGATVIIFVPTFKFLWGKSDDISHHIRRYRLPELRKKIEQSGLKVIRSSYFNFFLFFPILLARFLVRIFKIPIKSENEIEVGKGLVNSTLFKIFSLESKVLKRSNFSFGVSGLVVAKKN